MNDTIALDFATLSVNMMSTDEIDYRANLGEWIRMERNERGLSIRELAELLDISYQTVLNYEHGRRFPEPEIMLGLAKLWNVPPDYLYRVAFGLQPRDNPNGIAMDEDAVNMLDLILRLSEDERDLFAAMLRAAITKSQSQRGSLTNGAGETPDTGPEGL